LFYCRWVYGSPALPVKRTRQNKAAIVVLKTGVAGREQVQSFPSLLAGFSRSSRCWSLFAGFAFMERGLFLLLPFPTASVVLLKKFTPAACRRVPCFDLFKNWNPSEAKHLFQAAPLELSTAEG